MRYVVGIDPGKKGGISVIQIDNPNEIHGHHKMPEVQSELLELVRVLNRLFATTGTGKIFIEQCTYRTNQRGIVNMLTNYGRLLGYIESVGISYEVVSPQRWKKFFKLGSDKTDSINLANQLFGTSFTKTQDGLAESCLIAKYGLEQINK